MDSPIHSLSTLFEQLGLDETEKGIKEFISTNKPIPKDIELHEAEFWSSSQAGFLKESIEQDADWAEIVDHLDVMLRG